MLDLIKTRNQAGQEFYKTSQDLEAHKDKLLQNPDPSKWGINFAEVKMTPEEVAKNKLIAKSLMLPQQNRVMLEMKNIFGYFNHTMVKELTYMADTKAKRYIRSMNNFCSAQAESLTFVGFWLPQQESLFSQLRKQLLDVFAQLPEVRGPGDTTDNPPHTQDPGSPGDSDPVGSFKLVGQ